MVNHQCGTRSGALGRCESVEIAFYQLRRGKIISWVVATTIEYH